jgi:hypothetical protein
VCIIARTCGAVSEQDWLCLSIVSLTKTVCDDGWEVWWWRRGCAGWVSEEGPQTAKGRVVMMRPQAFREHRLIAR